MGRAAQFADGVMILPKKLLVNNTVKPHEDVDAKNEELFNMFVLECREMVIYFEPDVYVTEEKAGWKQKTSTEGGSCLPVNTPGSKDIRMPRQVFH